MEKNLLYFIILAVISIILTVGIKLSLNDFNKHTNSKIEENEKRVNDLMKFSYDIHFKLPPSEINIENPYECTATDLRVCDVNNPLSCIGCKSLLSSCVHFETDSKYIDYNGNEYDIPKNSSPTEGYCLTQKNTSQACNPYHGDLVLVQIDPDSRESMLYCNCKNPGYIGSLEINGACDEAFICNGSVEDINMPLNEIKCKCENDYTSMTVNDTPVCMEPTVGEFEKYDELFYNNIETVESDRFNSEIKSKFPGNAIKNPCKYCLLTGKYIENGTMVESDDGWQCATKDSRKGGLPIRRDPKHRILEGSRGPDAIIDAKLHELFIHGYMYDPVFEHMTVSLKVSENEEILNRMNIDTSKRFAYINLKDHDLVFPGSFGSMYINQSACLVCDGSESIFWQDDFFYTCMFQNYIGSDRRPEGYMLYDYNLSERPRVIAQMAPNCPPKAHSILTGWAFTDWKHYESKNPTYTREVVNSLPKYEIKEGFKTASDVRYIMYIYNFPNSKATFYGTEYTALYNVWLRNLIPK